MKTLIAMLTLKQVYLIIDSTRVTSGNDDPDLLRPTILK